MRTHHRSRGLTLGEVAHENVMATIWGEIDFEATLAANANLTHVAIRTLLLTSNTALWFKCSKHLTCADHRWQASVYSRVFEASGCPFCVLRNPHRRYCDCSSNDPRVLRLHRPDIFAQIDIDGTLERDQTLKRSMVMNVLPHSSVRLQFRCPAHTTCPEHVWVASIASRTMPRSAGCPFCAHKQTCACPGNGRLSVDRPEVFAELDVAKMQELDATFDAAEFGKMAIGSDVAAWWKCSNHTTCEGHRWSVSIGTRARGSGCPFCNRRSCPCPGSRLIRVARPDLFAGIDRARTLVRFPALALGLRGSNRSAGNAGSAITRGGQPRAIASACATHVRGVP